MQSILLSQPPSYLVTGPNGINEIRHLTINIFKFIKFVKIVAKKLKID